MYKSVEESKLELRAKTAVNIYRYQKTGDERYFRKAKVYNSLKRFLAKLYKKEV